MSLRENRTRDGSDATAVFDSGILCEAMDGDKEAMCYAAGIFLNDTPLQFRDMEAALSTGSYDHIHHLAHKIKGGALAIGAMRIAPIALTIENAAAARDENTLRKHLPEMEKEIRRFTNAVSLEFPGTPAG